MIEDLKRLLASRTVGHVEVETIEISHPDFTKTYYLVRNLTSGCVIPINGVDTVFQYCPMRWERSSAENNLDYELKITLQDLNEIVAPEINLISIDSEIMPSVVVRTYVMDSNGNIGNVADGPFVLGVRNITFDSQGCAFAASAKPLNGNGTGELYTFSRFETLRGFVQ